MNKETIDKITLNTALMVDIWKMVWAGEPLRKIEVEMTYNDLVVITDLLKREAEGGGNENE